MELMNGFGAPAAQAYGVSMREDGAFIDTLGNVATTPNEMAAMLARCRDRGPMYPFFWKIANLEMRIERLEAKEQERVKAAGYVAAPTPPLEP